MVKNTALKQKSEVNLYKCGWTVSYCALSIFLISVAVFLTSSALDFINSEFRDNDQGQTILAIKHSTKSKNSIVAFGFGLICATMSCVTFCRLCLLKPRNFLTKAPRLDGQPGTELRLTTRSLQ